jgi:hypothetical protein
MIFVIHEREIKILDGKHINKANNQLAYFFQALPRASQMTLLRNKSINNLMLVSSALATAKS